MTEAELGPLEALYESPALARSELTSPLGRLYGGGLGFAGPTVFANFVASLDGTVALPGLPRSNTLISSGSEADRFVMGTMHAGNVYAKARKVFLDAIVNDIGVLKVYRAGPHICFDRVDPDEIKVGQLDRALAAREFAVS